MKAVADAGPLIALSWLHRLDLLRTLAEEVLVPEAVAREVLAARTGTPGLDGLRAAFDSGQLHVRTVDDPMVPILEKRALHRGEAEVIALATKLPGFVALIDERRARRIATSRGLPVASTVGLLYLAHQARLLSAVHPLLLELRQRGFSLSDVLIEDARRRDSGAPRTEHSQ